MKVSFGVGMYLQLCCRGIDWEGLLERWEAQLKLVVELIIQKEE